MEEKFLFVILSVSEDFRRGELQLARRRRRHATTRVDALRACALAGAGELELAPTKINMLV